MKSHILVSFSEGWVIWILFNLDYTNHVKSNFTLEAMREVLLLAPETLVPMRTLFLQAPDHWLQNAVLLPAVLGDDLQLRAISPVYSRVGPTRERQTVVRAEHKPLPNAAQCPVRSD